MKRPLKLYVPPGDPKGVRVFRSDLPESLAIYPLTTDDDAPWPGIVSLSILFRPAELNRVFLETEDWIGVIESDACLVTGPGSAPVYGETFRCRVTTAGTGTHTKVERIDGEPLPMISKINFLLEGDDTGPPLRLFVLSEEE